MYVMSQSGCLIVYNPTLRTEKNEYDGTCDVCNMAYAFATYSTVEMAKKSIEMFAKAVETGMTRVFRFPSEAELAGDEK